MTPTLYIKFDETLAMRPFEILTNDRGRWQELHDDPDNGVQSFVGYGGENTLTFHYMFMQDGSTDFVVVHSSVDNPAKVAQRRVLQSGEDQFNFTRDRYNRLNAAVQCLLAEVCAFDPLEEVA